MAGAGFLILFVVSVVGCTIWSLIFLTFAAHYFLTTLTESSAGIDEVEYPNEGLIEWWWKPVFCLFILSIWVVPVTVIASPILAASPEAFVVGLVGLLLLVYPLSVMSSLYAQSWFFFLHPQVVFRMLRHFGTMSYVYLMTSLSLSVCGGLLFATFGRSFLWALPAAFVIPTALLLYARHWGRFSWLALNYLPGTARKKKPRRDGASSSDEPIPVTATPEAQTPVIDVEVIPDAISAGLPPMFPSAIQVGVPVTPEGIVAGMPGGATAAVAEEEDEWSTNKKPYLVLEDAPQPAVQPSVPAYDREPESEANKPLILSKYYDEKARKEKEAKAKKEAESRMMPGAIRGAPGFQETMLRGVWEFMIYSRTLRIWVNLVVLTAVELFFLCMCAEFFPRLD